MARRIDAELPGNKIQLTRDIITNIEKSIPYLGVFLRTLVGLSALVSGLVVMLAMYTTITERTREIGILKALGASRGFIVGEIVKEAVFISVIGVVAGFAVSFLVGYLIQRAYGAALRVQLGLGLDGRAHRPARRRPRRALPGRPRRQPRRRQRARVRMRAVNA